MMPKKRFKIRYCLGRSCTDEKQEEKKSLELKECVSLLKAAEPDLAKQLVEMPCLSVCRSGPIVVVENLEKRGENHWYFKFDESSFSEDLKALARGTILTKYLLGVGVHPKSPRFNIYPGNQS